MRNKSSSQSGIYNIRIASALVLCSLGASLGWLSFASTPPSGIVTPANDQGQSGNLFRRTVFRSQRFWQHDRRRVRSRSFLSAGAL